MVIEEFYSHVRKLVKHREAALVIEDAYREYATADQKAALLREFYGVEFAIFKVDISHETFYRSKKLVLMPKRTTGCR